jgi:proline iminopeptidase
LWFDLDGPAMRERPTVVLLHGWPGSFDHTDCKPEFVRVTGEAQVVYLDLYGHGHSDWGKPSAWSFEVPANLVRDFCDTLGIVRPVVYGHSLGGFVAMVYGVQSPRNAGALVLQSTCGCWQQSA